MDYYTFLHRSSQVDQLVNAIELHVGSAVYNYALPAYDTVMYYMRRTLHYLKPFLIASYPLISQIILMALGFALVPVLGPFGPLLTQFIGQLILYVVKMMIDNIGSTTIMYYSCC